MGFIGKIGGRKFIVALLGLIAVIVAATTGYEVKPELLQTAAAVIGSYLLGQGVADGLSGGATSSTPPPSSKDAG